MTETKAPKFELEIDGVPAAALTFLAFRAEERLFDCYRVEVDALCARLDPEALLGKSAAVYVRFEESPERGFHGIVWSAELTPLADKLFRLHVQIVPRLLTLSLGRNSRIFRDASLIDVVRQVLTGAGIPASAIELHVEKGPAHETVVQYAESDYDFIRRLLFEEGIGFLVQSEADGERVIFFDDGKALLAVDGLDTLVDRRRQDMRHDTAFDLREEARVTPDGAMLRDYDPKHPSGSPDASVPASPPPTRQVYQHPGGHLSLDTRAKRMLERLVMTHKAVRGGSYFPQLAPGRHLQLESEVRSALAGELTLVAVEHEGHVFDAATPAAYRNFFSAIPRGVPFRPESAPAAPQLPGPERAFVTGPAGQELHGDELGRVKVRFPWDRSGRTDDKSSSFLRVGQLMLSGSMIIPRVGFEVLVDHELGDVDRPYVSGHLFNEESAPPYASDRLTTSSIQSATTDGGPGANELRFGDSAGAEEVLMNASYDMSVRVENTLTWNVAKNEQLEVGTDATLLVTAQSTSNVGGNRTQTVGAMQRIDVGGNRDEGTGGNQAVTVGAMRKATIGGDQVENIAGTLKRAIGALQSVLVVDGFTRKIKGNSQVDVGAAWAETVAKSKSTSVSGARIEHVAALKLISGKSVALSASAAYAEKVSGQKVKLAKDRSDSAGGMLKVEAGTGISIKADNVTFTAQDQLTFTAGKVSFTLKKAGEIEIKAKEITIENSKAFAQITHKTN
jgi:type VI secretion system secreted protein VgrG